MASGKRNARLNKSLFKLKQEKNADLEEVDDELEDEVEDDQQWTKDETVRLMALIKRQLKERDTYSYIRRIQLLNWDEVKLCCPTALVEFVWWTFRIVCWIETMHLASALLSDGEYEAKILILCRWRLAKSRSTNARGVCSFW